MNQTIDGSTKSNKEKCKEFIDKYLNIDKVGESQIEQLSTTFHLKISNINEIISKLESSPKRSKRKNASYIVNK